MINLALVRVIYCSFFEGYWISGIQNSIVMTCHKPFESFLVIKFVIEQIRSSLRIFLSVANIISLILLKFLEVDLSSLLI